METFERINELLKINKMSKREFCERLLALEPKLKNTGEIPSESTVYAYLNGRIGIKIELISYMAEILGVPEQLLFDDSPKIRKSYLRHIINTISSEEKRYLRSHICHKSDQQKIDETYQNICELLRYAPELFLNDLESTLKSFKDTTLKFAKS